MNWQISIFLKKDGPDKSRVRNYWMRLSRIWRILQIKEGVIHRCQRPRWITPSEICRILHILRKPNSITANSTLKSNYSFQSSHEGVKAKKNFQVFFFWNNIINIHASNPSKEAEAEMNTRLISIWDGTYTSPFLKEKNFPLPESSNTS